MFSDPFFAVTLIVFLCGGVVTLPIALMLPWWALFIFYPALWWVSENILTKAFMTRPHETDSAMEEKRLRAQQGLLIGRVGTALSDLRPAGIAEFDGKRLDVVTSGEYIEKGMKIRIIAEDSNEVVVSSRLR